jgi:methylaspartate ammonia-lyase
LGIFRVSTTGINGKKFNEYIWYISPKVKKKKKNNNKYLHGIRIFILGCLKEIAKTKNASCKKTKI